MINHLSPRFVIILALLAPASCRTTGPTAQTTEQQTVRCAVIGGMVSTGMWQALSKRFEEATGYRVEIIAAGPKQAIAPAMREGRADLITMHASDTIINLVADGYAVDPQPWAKNDLVIVGPADDPAGIRGLNDATEAMRKIVRAGSPFAVHQSLGAQEVLRNVLHEAGVSLDPEANFIPPEELGARILAYAAKHEAYTLVGRIPFLSGKMPRAGLELMVQGDPRLRRPYVVAVANPKRWPEAHYEAARRMAGFLRERETQAWLADFGRGKLDDNPLFFPVVVERGHHCDHRSSVARTCSLCASAPILDRQDRSPARMKNEET